MEVAIQHTRPPESPGALLRAAEHAQGLPR
jgi:hypothetical protein